MKTRIIAGIVMFAMFVPWLILSNLFPQFMTLSFAMALLATVAVFEYLRCIGLNKKYFVSVPAYAFAAAFPFLAYLLRASNGWFLLLLGLVFIVYMIYLFTLAVLTRTYGDDTETSLDFSKISQCFVGVAYIVFGFTSVVMVRHLSFGGNDLGKYFYLLMFIGPWFTDTFAYFTGRFFGKHKLSPVISPKKTVEGSIGGIFFCILAFVGFAFIVGYMKDILSVSFVLFLAFAGLVVSLFSQVGDLIASMVKREHDVKDYGRLFPGHGGVMDRFDSVLGAAALLFATFFISSTFGLFI